MDNTLGVILAFLLSVVIFFIFPIYIAYEKKDDLAYATATKYVSDFVEDVKIKGYISADMYEKLKDRLRTTGNTYDIFLEHKANKIYPVEKKDKDGNVIGYDYKEVKEIYTEKQILPVIYDIDKDGDYTPKVYVDDSGKVTPLTLYREVDEDKNKDLKQVEDYDKLQVNKLPDIPNLFYTEDQDGVKKYIYTMNIGDEFSIRVKNSNISIAASLFNSFSTNDMKTDTTRVYVNYGAIITSEKYWN